MVKDNGGPALPIGSGDMRDPTGMTLRDWFAWQALVGILACKYWEVIRIDDPASAAYNLADAMLDERNKES